MVTPFWGEIVTRGGWRFPGPVAGRPGRVPWSGHGRFGVRTASITGQRKPFVTVPARVLIWKPLPRPPEPKASDDGGAFEAEPEAAYLDGLVAEVKGTNYGRLKLLLQQDAAHRRHLTAIKRLATVWKLLTPARWPDGAA